MSTVEAETKSGAKPSKPSMKERLQEHLAEYGAVALIIFFSIFAVTYLGFLIAIKSGINVGDSTAGEGGTYFAAWLATKITLPIRIGATLVLTPIVAAIIHKIKGKPKAKSETAEDAPGESEASSETTES